MRYLFISLDFFRNSIHFFKEARFKLSIVLFFTLSLTACNSEFTKPEIETGTTDDRREQELGSFVGEDTLTFGKKTKREEEDTILGVNSHLWRASLDTISFMPLASADPFGGVIITDWYSPPQSSHERLKINIFILNRQLRSDGLKVSVFRQERDKNGQWQDQSIDPQTVRDLENAILSRARHYRTIKQ